MTTKTSARPPRILLSFEQLRARGVPFTRVHINRMMEAGQFPRAVEISQNRIAWDASEIDAWIASRPRRALASERRAARMPTGGAAA